MMNEDEVVYKYAFMGLGDDVLFLSEGDLPDDGGWFCAKCEQSLLSSLLTSHHCGWDESSLWG